MQKIIPFLWFDSQAEEAAAFYTGIFPNSAVGFVNSYGESGAEVSGKSEGSVSTVEFTLDNQLFTAINGGPEFKFTPAVSFFVSCDTESEVCELWRKFSNGAAVLMELGEYPFNQKYGWLCDRYGVSWQFGIGKSINKITPFLMFTGEQFGKAKAALTRYTEIFPNSFIENFSSNEDGSLQHGVVRLAGQELMAIDSGIPHGFGFSGAISFLIQCGSQEETDQMWEKLTDNGQEIQCGWLKDVFGVTWQVVPEGLNELLGSPDSSRTERVMKEMFTMKKIDITRLREVFER